MSEEKKELQNAVENTSAPATPELSKKELKAKEKTEKKAVKEARAKKSMDRSKKWFRELKSEFKKIVWPTRKQVLRNTGVVVLVIAIMSICVALLDFVFQSLFLEGLLKLVAGA